jgi:hypothetical protein
MMINNGIFGTLMGWFNQQRLYNLHDQLKEVQGQQNWLLQIQMVTLHQIDEMEDIMRDVPCELQTAQFVFINYWSLIKFRSSFASIYKN